MKKKLMLAVSAVFLMACGTEESPPHDHTPVDPNHPYVVADVACKDLADIGNIIYSKEAPCLWEMQEADRQFRGYNYPPTFCATEGYGSKCFNETKAREVYRLCVTDRMSYCEPGKSEQWYEVQRLGCLKAYREFVLDIASCDLPY